MRPYIYLSSSWKNRDRVRAMATKLTKEGYDVYDFTNPSCRNSPELAPETFPAVFDPETDLYQYFLKDTPEFSLGVEGNQKALQNCDAVVLLLPCGNDAHADAYYALGLGKRLIVCGQPPRGDITPSHLLADEIVDYDENVPTSLRKVLSK